MPRGEEGSYNTTVAPRDCHKSNDARWTGWVTEVMPRKRVITGEEAKAQTIIEGPLRQDCYNAEPKRGRC